MTASPATESHQAETALASPRPPIDPDVAYDAIVVGSGSGGLTAAAGLARFGQRVLLVERHHVGGDCTNVGCIPSKSLLHLAGSTRRPSGSAETDRSDRPPADRAGSSDASPAVLARVRHRRTHLRTLEEVEFGNKDEVDLRFGDARLTGRGWSR